MSQNYKDSLNLPKTDFSMKADLVKREPERLAKWETSDLYSQIQEARKDGDLFVLHDGPPFANGDVHMGTALNKVLKDIVVKSRSMLGFRAPYVPGWDCHGLPIEFKVVKESRGLAPGEVRRRSEEYARKYIDIQRQQFKRLGVLGEWENPYLTLEPVATKRTSSVPSPVSSSKGWSINPRSRSIGAPARRPRWPRPRWNTPTATIPRFSSSSRS